MRGYTAAVRDVSYRLGDEDVARLVAAGRAEDEIVELTVGAALSAYDDTHRVVDDRHPQE